MGVQEEGGAVSETLAQSFLSAVKSRAFGEDLSNTTSRAKGAAPVTSRPRNSTVPEVGCSTPAISRSTVVFPEPEGPSIEKNSPSAMSRSTPSAALTALTALTASTALTALTAPNFWSGQTT